MEIGESRWCLVLFILAISACSTPSGGIVTTDHKDGDAVPDGGGVDATSTCGADPPGARERRPIPLGDGVWYRLRG